MKEPGKNTEKDDQGILLEIIKKAFAVPGVKVNRTSFLSECFEKYDAATLNIILEAGPVNAGIQEKELLRMARALVNKRTAQSTGMSFASGIPGGPIGLTAGLSVDTIQFFGVAMRLAQEISYLYGNNDFWADNVIDDVEATNELLMYIGVMFGVSSASAAVRVVSSAFARTALNRLPRVALTKTVIYPIIKSIAKILSVRMTKDIFAKSISKMIPIIGGVVSGTITFASMRPMGFRLVEQLNKANFSYTERDFESDMSTLSSVSDAEYYEFDDNDFITKENRVDNKDSLYETLVQLKQLLDDGILSKEEFDELKKKTIERF